MKRCIDALLLPEWELPAHNNSVNVWLKTIPGVCLRIWAWCSHLCKCLSSASLFPTPLSSHCCFQSPLLSQLNASFDFLLPCLRISLLFQPSFPSFSFSFSFSSPLVKKSLQAGFSSTYNAELVLLSGTKCHPGGHFSLCYIRICNPKLATSPIIELLLCRADNYQNFQSHTSETKRDALRAFVTLIYVRKADKKYSSATTFLALGIGSCPLWWAIKYVYYGNNTLYLNEGTCSPARTVVLYKKKTSITQNCSLDLE